MFYRQNDGIIFRVLQTYRKGDTLPSGQVAGQLLIRVLAFSTCENDSHVSVCLLDAKRCDVWQEITHDTFMSFVEKFKTETFQLIIGE